MGKQTPHPPFGHLLPQGEKVGPCWLLPTLRTLEARHTRSWRILPRLRGRGFEPAGGKIAPAERF